MPPRTLKRLEDLLRRGLDRATTVHEAQVAFTEALRVVVTLRQGGLAEGEPWQEVTLLRYETCVDCGEDLKPATRAMRRGAQHMHRLCHAERCRALERAAP